MDHQSENKKRIAIFASFIFLVFTAGAYAQPPNRPSLPRPPLYKLQSPVALKERLAAQKVQATKPLPPTSGEKACPPNCDGLLAKIQKHGPQMIVVNLKQSDLPDYTRAPKADRAHLIEARQQAITARQDRVLSRLSAQNIKFKNVTKSKYAPSIGITADSTMLKALMADPEVESIEENVIMHLMLNQSVPLIGADVAWTNGFTGNGYTIAILDTGVDTSHPFLASKVLDEHCFSANDSGTDPVLGPWTITSLCPNGQTEQAGAGAAQPCTLAGCEHGTHVAGIAAGHSYAPIAFSGVAKDATLDCGRLTGDPEPIS